MRKFFARILDGKDRGVEAHAFLIVVAFFALVIFSCVSVFKTGAFDAGSFGQAVGLILGGGGFAAIGQSLLDKGNKDGD